MTSYYHVLFPSSFGDIGIVWQGMEESLKIHRVFLSDVRGHAQAQDAQEHVKAAFPSSTLSSAPTIAELGVKI